MCLVYVAREGKRYHLSSCCPHLLQHGTLSGRASTHGMVIVQSIPRSGSIESFLISASNP